MIRLGHEVRDTRDGSVWTFNTYRLMTGQGDAGFMGIT